MSLLPFLLFNGIGFNGYWARSVPEHVFIQQHMHLWDGKPRETVERDLKNIYAKLNALEQEIKQPKGNRLPKPYNED